MADNLDEAQQLADTSSYADRAAALALIDIARSLRDINELFHQWDTYGAPRRRFGS
jgi:hypothetical protein